MQHAFCSQVGRWILIMFQENLMSLRVTNNCVSYQNDTFKIESETKNGMTLASGHQSKKLNFNLDHLEIQYSLDKKKIEL